MRISISLLFALAALGSAPATAEVYKWVDKQGRTHYSDEVPKGAKTRAIEDRLSLYSPEPAVAQALQAAVRRNPAAAQERIAALERQLQAERFARQPGGTSDTTAAYERCVADRRTDCDQVLSGAMPYPRAS